MTDLQLDLETAGVSEVQEALTNGAMTSADVVAGYLGRVEALDRHGPAVHAIRCVAPDAQEQAERLDAERELGRIRGPMHGIPVLVKDNIDVAGLPTTAGTLALEHSVPDRDAGLVERLREAGLIILGKTNLTEMANFMGEQMPSGYSSLGGQVLNPYDASLTPCGSSSGSGAAAALGFGTVTVGTETDGSILCPSDAQSLVGLKPGLGVVSGDGILPIATSQDCAGPMCRTVADAASLFAALTATDVVELRTGALRDVRLAVPPPPEDLDAADRELFDAALAVLRELGARTVEVAPLPETDESPVLHHEFARDLDAYLARLPPDRPIATTADLVAWNEAHAEAALKYGQAHLVKALSVDHAADDAAYRANRARDLAVAGIHGIDATLVAADAVAIVTPGPASAGVAARAGYPSLIVPAGYRRVGRRPVGLTLLGPAHSEALLLALAYDYEQAAGARRPVSVVNPSLLR